MPFIMGSVTPSTALAAMAASTAEPPRARISAPACEACTWLVATMPKRVTTMERAWERSWAGTDMLVISRMRVNATLTERGIVAPFRQPTESGGRGILLPVKAAVKLRGWNRDIDVTLYILRG